MVYKYRTGLSLTLLLIGVYFVMYNWLVLPPLVMAVGWLPDIELRALSFAAMEADRQSLEPGDQIVAIDGRTVRRGEAVFSRPLKSVYTVEIIRGESRMIQEIYADERAFYNVWLISQAILGLAIWFVGYLTAYFAHPQHSAALYAGLGFQLIAVGIISPGPSQMGAPGGWIIGHVLIVYFPFILLYLAFVPSSRPLSQRSQRALRAAFYGLTLLAGAAAFEVLVLFSDHSWQSLTGVRTFAVIALVSGVGVIASLSILLIRQLRLPAGSYERQQLRILFTFLTLALLPLFALVILPASAFIFVPLPFVYSLFLLAPAGYFFVLHRQGFLQLDLIFSRAITLVILVLAIVMAYGTGMYLWKTVVGIEISSAGYGGFALLLFGLGIVGQRQVQSYVDFLIYGHDPFSQEAIQATRLKLSAKPETATITDILMQLSASMQIRQAAVFVKNEKQFDFLTGNVEPFTVLESPFCQKMLLRTREREWMADLPAWVELSVPILAGNDTLGLLMMARPVSGYFNARQVGTIRDVADIVAFGLLIISLIETMQALSQQALYEKQLQRQEIATEIHNEPLHLLTTVLMDLRSDASAELVQKAMERLGQVAIDLRRIIAGLRPPLLKDSVSWITRQLVRQFDETEADVEIVLHRPEIESPKAASEQTKIAFFNVLNEALHNISKHAQATRIEITLFYDEDQIVLEVKDDGVGADCLNWSLVELLRAHHMGLADMHRWALIGGGKLTIKPNAPAGTAVKLTLPMTPPGTTVTAIYQ